MPRLCKAGSLTSPALPASSSLHLPNHCVAASHTLSPLGHPPLLRPTFALLPWHHWGRAVHPAGHSGAVPSTPSPQRGSRTPPTDFGAGCSLQAGGGTLSTTPWFISRGDPTVCQVRDRTICWDHFWAVEAARGRGNLRSGSGLGSWAGRILSVALGSARRQATPPFGHCPGGSSCGSGNCSHPSPSSGYSAPPPASRARPGKRSLSLQRVLFPCAKLGVWKRSETGLLSRVCTLKPERRPPGIALFWDATWRLTALLEQILLLGWLAWG